MIKSSSRLIVFVAMLLAVAVLSLLTVVPDSNAQGTIPTAIPGPVYLPLVSKFVPTATPTPTLTPTGTATSVPDVLATLVAQLTSIAETATASTPTATSVRRFNVAMVYDCLPQEAGNWFQGTTYIDGRPANGYKVVFSYAPNAEPVTDPVVSGPHEGYPGWKPGYYSHIIHASGPQVGDWYVWIINDEGQRISEVAHWHSTGPGGDCNEATVDFDSR